MLPVPEALERILATVQPRPVETVPLSGALGRVLASPVVSPVDVPPWDCSAMDGYAVRAADTSDDGVSLRVLEVVHAGEVPTQPLVEGTTTGVMTGAPLPEGADAVVVVEDSDGAKEGHARLGVRQEVGKYIRRRGSDVRKGATVLQAGEVLTPARLGVAASVGCTEVTVAQPPTVAVLATGDEVVRPGRPLGPGQIYSSNSVALLGLVTEAGAVGVDAGIAPDDPVALGEAVDAALARADIVLTTGGVSVGDHDHVKAVLAERGVDMDFWKVAMKPGKPLAFGTLQRDGRTQPVFGLPGNPVSCMVNFLQFVRPWIRRSLGDPTPFLPIVDAVAAEPLKGRPGRARLERVILSVGDDGAWQAASTGNQSSGILTSMARGHGLVLIDADNRGPDAGDPVRVQLLDPSFLDLAAPDYRW